MALCSREHHCGRTQFERKSPSCYCGRLVTCQRQDHFRVFVTISQDEFSPDDSDHIPQDLIWVSVQKLDAKRIKFNMTNWFRVSASFPGCVVDLATWMDLCYEVCQLWHQEINETTISFMEAGKTDGHVAGQDHSRPGKYWQWLYLECSEMPPKEQPSALNTAAAHISQLCC